MTKLWEEQYNKRIEDFSYFLSSTGMTQTRAAELLDISRGQLSHLLKYERTLNDFIYNRMKFIMENKQPQITGGIYGIYYNNNLIYIGQTKNFKSRFASHKTAIKHSYNDCQPFHQSKLDVNFLSYKILFSCEIKFLYPYEINRLEELLIRVCLPEWNTNVATLSSRLSTAQERINELFYYHPIHLKLLQYELNNYELPLTNEGEEMLKYAGVYSDEEIYEKASKIVSHNKERITEEEQNDVMKNRAQQLQQMINERSKLKEETCYGK